jgi:high frequency lysogenization protein
MQLKSITNQTIALAGIAQAATLVQQQATRGTADQASMEASIGSILKIDSDNVEAIFGGLDGLKLGIEQLKGQLSGERMPDRDQARYAASIVVLERKLSTDKAMLGAIREGIGKAQIQSEQFGLLHENLLANLGGLYQNTISTIQPRIMVNGDQSLLTQSSVSNKIRALLLAGIRAAVLWRQCGGARWKFIFYRRKIQDELERLASRLQ